MGPDLGEMKLVTTGATPLWPDHLVFFIINAVLSQATGLAMLHLIAPVLCKKAISKLLGRRSDLLRQAVSCSLWAFNALLAVQVCIALPVVLSVMKSGPLGDKVIAVLSWLTALVGLPTSAYLTASSGTPYLASTTVFSLVTSSINASLALGDNSWMLNYIWAYSNTHMLMLSVSRLWAVEEASFIPFGGRWAWLAFLGVAGLSPFTVLNWVGPPPAVWWFNILTLIPMLLLVCFFAMRGLGQAASQAEALAKGAPSALQAAAALRANFFALVPGFIPFGLRVLLTLMLGDYPMGGSPFDNPSWVRQSWSWFWLLVHAPQELGNFLAVLLLSGALTGAAAGARDEMRKRSLRLRRRRLALQAAKGTEGDPSEEDWEEAVHDLAGRGISLKAILDFYEHLPEQMPHYDASRHRTTDVVRGAVIPLSAPSRSALAQVLMKGKRTVPEVMVTHNWGNLFRDLIAAILVEALEEAEFENMAYLLVHDFTRVRAWVMQAGVGDMAFWVCAFSVNQHKSICANISSSANDCVSGLPFQLCDCGAQKARNDTPPCLLDGRSVPCEMNKFREMIRHLAHENPDFKQVVAVDRMFVLFNRAWCVAELAMAHDLGMVQHLKIPSSDALWDHERDLRGLRIEDMNASRAEDKEEILRKIDDKDAFNAALQRLLFEDLIPSFKHLDSEARARKGGQMLRWHHALPPDQLRLGSLRD